MVIGILKVALCFTHVDLFIPRTNESRVVSILLQLLSQVLLQLQRMNFLKSLALIAILMAKSSSSIQTASRLKLLQLTKVLEKLSV